MEYLQKKNKLLEEDGCVYSKVQSNSCTFIAYVIRIILITEAVLYQVSGLFVTPGGLSPSLLGGVLAVSCSSR